MTGVPTRRVGTHHTMASSTGPRNDGPQGVVAVGASAGGVEALTHFAAGMPRDLPYAITVVLHIPADAPSVLARIIDRSGPLRAYAARHGARLESGNIYVGVPDHHLLVHDGTVFLSEGPTENGHRPAINALFRSVALAYGPRAIGVLLSGVLDDGVLGSAAIRSRGGTTVAQHPADAAFPAMPLNALNAGVIDRKVSAAEVGELLKELSNREFEERETQPDPSMELENRVAMGKRFSISFNAEALGPRSGYTCPDCKGAVMAVSEGNFRCRVGHVWTADALFAARDEEAEGALHIALRSLQEKAKLSRKLAETAGRGSLSDKYNTTADEAEHAVRVLTDRLSETYRETGRGEASAG
jgi:two-component system, chemotaxis family, protein-glutamate methylesterase/glutaminase